MYVYVDDVDKVVARLRAEEVKVLKDPADMPWGERIATIADPDGNPVASPTSPATNPDPQPVPPPPPVTASAQNRLLCTRRPMPAGQFLAARNSHLRASRFRALLDRSLSVTLSRRCGAAPRMPRSGPHVAVRVAHARRFPDL